MRIAIHVVRAEANVFKQLNNSFRCLATAHHALQPKRFCNLAPDPHARIERLKRVLKDHLHVRAHPSEIRVRDSRHWTAVKRHVAPRRLFEPQNALPNGGLAAAALAHKSQRLPLWNRECHILDSYKRSVAKGTCPHRIVLGQVVNIDDLPRCRQRRRWVRAELTVKSLCIVVCGCSRYEARLEAASGSLHGIAHVRSRGYQVEAFCSMAARLARSGRRHGDLLRRFRARVPLVRRCRARTSIAGGIDSRWGASEGRERRRDRDQVLADVPLRSCVIETYGVRMPRRCENGAHVGLFHHPARVHYHNPIAQLRNDPQIVRNDDLCESKPVSQAGEKTDNLQLDRYIESRCRLIGDQQVGLTSQGQGDHDTLAHAAR